MDSKLLLPICLLGGLVVMIGLRGIGWIAHLLVPGLVLGVVFFAILKVVGAIRS